jgi:hypothetical protein
MLRKLEYLGLRYQLDELKSSFRAETMNMMTVLLVRLAFESQTHGSD